MFRRASIIYLKSICLGTQSSALLTSMATIITMDGDCFLQNSWRMYCKVWINANFVECIGLYSCWLSGEGRPSLTLLVIILSSNLAEIDRREIDWYDLGSMVDLLGFKIGLTCAPFCISGSKFVVRKLLNNLAKVVIASVFTCLIYKQLILSGPSVLECLKVLVFLVLWEESLGMVSLGIAYWLLGLLF